MNRFSLSIAKYILKTIVPYFIFSWLLLSVILFAQQASRYSDILFSNNLPSKLIWQLTFALVPNVIAFTCPMAILIGVIIGISKLHGDSELVAIRAAGVSNIQLTVPVVFIGIILSLFAFLINLKGVPFAAQIVRDVAMQTALYKIESPIEPGVFNTEIQDFTIYVKNGDVEKGSWKNIFIYKEDTKDKQARLITSDNGRIDTKNENSELVLENAIITTISTEKPYKYLFAEKSNGLRFLVQTKRKELVDKISQAQETPEEMGLSELAEYARSKTGKDKVEAEILWQRRIVLSITPLIFAMLGAALILRFNRGGRGFGIFLALISLVIYYLIALLGEQLARTGKVSVIIASLFPVSLTLIVIAWFFLSQRFFITSSGNIFDRINFQFKRDKNTEKLNKSHFLSLTTGILDFDIVTSILRYFLLTFGFLTSIYLIFTAFELWKFAGNIDGGIKLLIKYLLFLIPFIYIQISPSALMVAMLATYVIKSRQNEVVTWTASGQSIYRLLLPCFILMMVIGFVNWEIQERVLSKANQIQDALRAQIRNNGVTGINAGKHWVASGNRIYSFELADDTQPGEDRRRVRNLTIYQFSAKETKLEYFIKSNEASWEKGEIKFIGDVEKTVWVNDIPQTDITSLKDSGIIENYNPFNQSINKPTHLNTEEIIEQLRTADSESEQRSLGVALQKKYSTLFLPLIITLFTAPFALSLSRKGKVATVGYAVGIWLLFTGITNAFEQFGLSGFVSPAVAIWGPLLLFTLLGGYLLSRVRT